MAKLFGGGDALDVWGDAALLQLFTVWKDYASHRDLQPERNDPFRTDVLREELSGINPAGGAIADDGGTPRALEMSRKHFRRTGALAVHRSR